MCKKRAAILPGQNWNNCPWFPWKNYSFPVLVLLFHLSFPKIWHSHLYKIYIFGLSNNWPILYKSFILYICKTVNLVAIWIIVFLGWNLAISPIKHIVFEELLWQPVNHYVSNFYISMTFKDVSNTLQNFTFMGTTVFEMVGGGPPEPPPPLSERCGCQRLGKGRVKQYKIYLWQNLQHGKNNKHAVFQC